MTEREIGIVSVCISFFGLYVSAITIYACMFQQYLFILYDPVRIKRTLERVEVVNLNILCWTL